MKLLNNNNQQEGHYARNKETNKTEKQQNKT